MHVTQILNSSRIQNTYYIKSYKLKSFIIMAATRQKRANAGNKMARLLNEEEEDDFYKTTYGGFDEVEQDNDYMYVIIFITCMIYKIYNITYMKI